MSEGQSGLDEAILQQVPSMCDVLGLNRFTPIYWQKNYNRGEKCQKSPRLMHEPLT